MSPQLRLGSVLLATVAATGCVFPDQVAQLQKDVADAQQDARRVAKEQADTKQALSAMERKLSEDPVQRTEIADLKLRVDELSRRIAAVMDSVEQANRRMDRMSQDVQAGREVARRAAANPAPGAPPPGSGADETGGAANAPARPPAGANALPSPEALYNAAYTDFSKGNFDLAIQGFQEYARQFPKSDLADNALYWVGECHYSQAAYADAVRAFDRMLDAYPQSDKAPAANLKKGLAFLEQNQISQAIVQLRHVVATYPEADEAKIARDRLAGLGKPVDSPTASRP